MPFVSSSQQFRHSSSSRTTEDKTNFIWKRRLRVTPHLPTANRVNTFQLVVGREEKIILLVEDSDDDAALFARSLRRSGCEGLLHHVSTAEHAIKSIDSGMHPRLVFLDLLLPNLRGVHFLRWIRDQADCKCIPVVVLAGAVSQRTLEDLCALGANAVMVKPSTLSALQEAVGAACTFWLKHCVPPRGTEPD